MEPAMLRPCLALLALLSPPALASDLLGPEACRTCHAEAYKAWSQSGHARAAESLPAAQRQQPLCLQCHSRDEARSGAAAVSGVSCETCHGGGRFYAHPLVMRDHELARLFGLTDPGPASCLACHGGEQNALSGPFDLKAALPKIDHWTADRAARKAARIGAAEPTTPVVPLKSAGAGAR
jgi:hypothetical protein